MADPLARLVGLIRPTLPMYLADSGIWTYPGAEPIRLALADAAADLGNVVDRSVALLEEREIASPRAAYPLAFTALHDVDVASLVPRVVGVLRRLLSDLDALEAPAAEDAAAADLVADAKRSCRQHVDVLEQLAARTRAGLAAAPTTAG